MKAQVSIEFFIYFSITIFILSVLTVSLADRQSQINDLRESFLAESIGAYINYEMEQAEAAGEGYSREIEIPNSILGNNYNVSYDSGLLLVDWGEERVIRSSRLNSVQDSDHIDVKPEKEDIMVKNNGSVFIESY